MVPAWVGK